MGKTHFVGLSVTQGIELVGHIGAHPQHTIRLVFFEPSREFLEVFFAIRFLAIKNWKISRRFEG